VESLIPTLKKTVAALEERRIPYVLGGSIACWAHGGSAIAADLDFMIKPEDADRALVALVDSGMREERPPEQWLVKAWDGPVLVDLIYEPAGFPVTDDVIARGRRLSVAAMRVWVMALEDVMTTKLMSLGEHSLDYEDPLQIARSLRERIDWAEVRSRTEGSPYANPFFTLLEALELTPRVEERELAKPRIRVA